MCGDDHATENCPELELCAEDNNQHQHLSRARLTLPKYLEIVHCPGGTTGVLAAESISAKVQFGPFEAKRVLHLNDKQPFPLKVKFVHG